MERIDILQKNILALKELAESIKLSSSQLHKKEEEDEATSSVDKQRSKESL